jgi:hypothetical protein
MAQDLSLDMTADPSEFTEAVEEFAARRVISREEADTIEAYARRRAWWISGVAQMDVANDAHQSIIEAMRDGVSFDDWKKKAGAAIEAEWGRKDSARLQLIFRNATSQAYNAGRLEQMEQPHIVAVRPYKMLDVVQDTRTSQTCRQYTNPEVVLPWDDPFWLTHSPPLHHGCRSGIRSLRRGPAARQGITKPEDLPENPIPEGWGFHPSRTVPPTPSERTNPPDPELQLMAAVKGGKHLRESKPVAIPKRLVADPPRRLLNDLEAEEIPFGDAFPGTAASDDLSPKDKAAGAVKFFEATKANLSDLSKIELQAVDRYTSEGYSAIRDARRLDAASYKAKYPIASLEKHSELADSIDALIARKRALVDRPEKSIREMYRGLNILSKDDFERTLNESSVKFDAVTSSSWKSDAALSFCTGEGQYSVFYRIKPAKNSNSLAIESASVMSGEHEVLFGKDTGFKVTKVTRDAGNPNGAIIWLEEID